MKKIVSFLLTLALCVTCASAFAYAEEAVALPDFYRTCADDVMCIQCKGNAQNEEGTRYLHIVGDEGTSDAYFFPENGWGPEIDHPVMLLKYRSSGGSGQLFFTTSALNPGDSGTYTDVAIAETGDEWQYMVYDFQENAFACYGYDATKVVFFRIDLNAISWMDYAFVAFFKTGDEANAFADADKAGKVKLIDDAALVVTKYVISPRSLDPMQFNGHNAAIEFTVPEGQSFKAFILTQSPTWGKQENANLDASIYAWNRDYDTTIEGTALGTFREEAHVDNNNLTMDFGVILPPGKYVILMTAEDDTIGAWGGNLDEINFDALFYFDDVENENWFPFCELLLAEGTDQAIEIPTPAPTAEPTEKPTAAPTAEPTEAVVTEAPTDEPAAEPTKAPGGEAESEKGGLPTGAVIGIVAGVVVAAAAVAGILIGRSKKKK